MGGGGLHIPLHALQPLPGPAARLLEQAKQHVGGKRALVCLIQDDHAAGVGWGGGVGGVSGCWWWQSGRESWTDGLG